MTHNTWPWYMCTITAGGCNYRIFFANYQWLTFQLVGAVITTATDSRYEPTGWLWLIIACCWLLVVLSMKINHQPLTSYEPSFWLQRVDDWWLLSWMWLLSTLNSWSLTTFSIMNLPAIPASTATWHCEAMNSFRWCFREIARRTGRPFSITVQLFAIAGPSRKAARHRITAHGATQATAIAGDFKVQWLGGSLLDGHWWLESEESLMLVLVHGSCSIREVERSYEGVGESAEVPWGNVLNN